MCSYSGDCFSLLMPKRVEENFNIEFQCWFQRNKLLALIRVITSRVFFLLLLTRRWTGWLIIDLSWISVCISIVDSQTVCFKTKWINCNCTIKNEFENTLACQLTGIAVSSNNQPSCMFCSTDSIEIKCTLDERM